MYVKTLRIVVGACAVLAILAFGTSPRIPAVHAYAGAGMFNEVKLGGNAGKDARLEFTGGCYIGHNLSSSKRIKFGLGNVQAVLAPGASHTFVDLAGHCFSSFYPGGPWANYE